MQDSKQAAKAWARQQTRQAWRPALPVVVLGLVNTLCAVLQAWCVAGVLGATLRGYGIPPAFLGGFLWLAVCRAGLQFAGENAAFEAGAAGRAALRADVIGRVLAAGPAILRGRHSADLAAAAVDQVEAMNGLYASWVPASPNGSLHRLARRVALRRDLNRRQHDSPRGPLHRADLRLHPNRAGIGRATAARQHHVPRSPAYLFRSARAL